MNAGNDCISGFCGPSKRYTCASVHLIRVQSILRHDDGNLCNRNRPMGMDGGRTRVEIGLRIDALMYFGLTQS